MNLTPEEMMYIEAIEEEDKKRSRYPWKNSISIYLNGKRVAIDGKVVFNSESHAKSKMTNEIYYSLNTKFKTLGRGNLTVTEASEIRKGLIEKGILEFKEI